MLSDLIDGFRDVALGGASDVFSVAIACFIVFGTFYGVRQCYRQFKRGLLGG